MIKITIVFRFHQYQAGQLVATDGNPYKVIGMMRYHHPSIERACAGDAVTNTTVEEALKTPSWTSRKRKTLGR